MPAQARHLDGSDAHSHSTSATSVVTQAMMRININKWLQGVLVHSRKSSQLQFLRSAVHVYQLDLCTHLDRLLEML